MGIYKNNRGQEVHYHQDQTMGYDYMPAGMDEIPGYLIPCNNGRTYLVFAPDMTSLQHMFCYSKLLNNADTYVTNYMCDHMTKICQPDIMPAYTNEFYDEPDCLHRKILTAPASEMGKIYVLDDQSEEK